MIQLKELYQIFRENWRWKWCLCFGRSTVCKLKFHILVFPRSSLLSLLLYIRGDCFSFSRVVTVTIVCLVYVYMEAQVSAFHYG